jgi:hypothetical protein
MELDSNAIVGRVLMKGHENSNSASGGSTAAQVSVYLHMLKGSII